MVAKLCLLWAILQLGFLFIWGNLVYQTDFVAWVSRVTPVWRFHAVVAGTGLIALFLMMTRGLERVTEVGARFREDGLPGRLLAIDSEVKRKALEPQAATARQTRLRADAEAAKSFAELLRITGHGVWLFMALAAIAIGDVLVTGRMNGEWRTLIILLVWAVAVPQGLHVAVWGIAGRVTGFLGLGRNSLKSEG